MRQPLRTEAWRILTAALALLACAKADAQEARKPPSLAQVQRVANLAYAPDGSFLLLQYDVWSLGIWDTKTGQFRVKLEEKVSPGWECIDVSPDGKKAAAINMGRRHLH